MCERERKREKERKCVCVREGEREKVVCVCVCEQNRASGSLKGLSYARELTMVHEINVE